MTPPQNILDRLALVRLLAFDVDGVMTDGGIYLGDNVELKRFNAHDGAGIALALKAGYAVVVITGRTSVAVERRCHELGVTRLFQGVKDKVAVLQEVIEREHMDWRQVLYMGDDLPDLPLFGKVGLAVAPRSATTDARERAHFVARNDGGHGAVREVIEMVLRGQGRWAEALQGYQAARTHLAQ